ncbi:hypothetical protein RvY_11358 [Ramazzottius varieornatus]|uniref:GMP synthase (glutamine-hydrolyzing) n=1 Tax=Ramazzottius varieornatus TaxID=947166 RepID=A0A1D1VFV8_RAMVA|nr:hypothetical protein RvY_11358 [Ramazzottius varieornatus]
MSFLSGKSRSSSATSTPNAAVVGSRSSDAVEVNVGSKTIATTTTLPVNGNGFLPSDNVDKVAILDAGSQYGKVIDRRIRELNVYTDILPLETPLSVLLEKKYKAVIISGGPSSVYGEGVLSFDAQIFNSPVPVLGICYGFQLLNKVYGGTIAKTSRRNDGQTEVAVDESSPLFKKLKTQQQVLLTHGDSVIAPVPAELKVIAKYHELVVGLANEKNKKYGLQFHPEVDLTTNGAQIFSNFLFDIAEVKPNFRMNEREKECLHFLKTNIKNKTVLLLASGGVDSTVCAALLSKVVPKDKLIVLHIDNGFMRKNESQEVVKNLSKLGLNVIHRNYSERFHYARRRRPEEDDGAEYVSVMSPTLSETIDPEEKRKIIGDTFMELANHVLKDELKLDMTDVLLCQGTLRPDLIESASKIASHKADAIKTHHNDTNFVRLLRDKGLVIEPLKDFHKDEVRKLGMDLGLPEEMVYRHPFPGPGLAVRVICASEPYKARDYDRTVILLRIICSFSDPVWHLSVLHESVKQSLTPEEITFLEAATREHKIAGHVLPIRSVGVQGDGRSFKHVAALSTDESSRIPWLVLFRLAELIPRICQSISRVAYAFGPRIIYEVEFITETTLTPFHVVTKIQEVDAIAQQVLWDSGCYRKIAQMPVILIPVEFDVDTVDPQYPGRKHSVVLRPFISNDFMTGKAAIPGQDLPEEVVIKMAQSVAEVGGVSRVLYDLTCKPPGTTEWE